MAKTDDSAIIDTGKRHTFDHDDRGPVELGTRVTTAVATVTDNSPEEVGESLAETVDLDGLDRLFQTGSDETPHAGGRLVLSVNDCFVIVSSDGTVTVEP